MITNSGLIEDYTNDGEKNRTFPHLKQTYYTNYFPGVKGFKSVPYNNFGVYYNNFLHFLSCDTEKSVKIYHIDNKRIRTYQCPFTMLNQLSTDSTREIYL